MVNQRPNPSLDSDVPRAGAAPAAAGRRLACFIRRHIHHRNRTFKGIREH